MGGDKMDENVGDDEMVLRVISMEMLMMSMALVFRLPLVTASLCDISTSLPIA